jgi:hypothetical protein
LQVHTEFSFEQASRTTIRQIQAVTVNYLPAQINPHFRLENPFEPNSSEHKRHFCRYFSALIGRYCAPLVLKRRVTVMASGRPNGGAVACPIRKPGFYCGLRPQPRRHGRLRDLEIPLAGSARKAGALSA